MMLPVIFIAAAMVDQQELLLFCDGATVAQAETDRTDIESWDNDGSRVEGSIVSSAPSKIPFHVEFRLTGDRAQMQIPAMAVQGAKGDANWFPVTDLVVSDAEISGKVKLGFFYGSSRFRIDRRTGKMTTAQGFQGICEKQDLSTNKF